MSLSSCFIGVDLAWSPRNTTGVASLVPLGNRLTVAAEGIRETDRDICDFIRQHVASTTIVMIDAPLIVLNQTGRRECDGLTHQRFGRQQAGAYPANRKIMGRYNSGIPRGEALGLQLRDRLRFTWPPPDVREAAGQQGRFVFECYPHPAQVVLFGLQRTLKYKRKRQGLPKARAEFAQCLRFVQQLSAPSVEFEEPLIRALDVSAARGRVYKACEDRLDALFCAYLAALVPEGRMQCLGEPEHGSIVIPAAFVRSG